MQNDSSKNKVNTKPEAPIMDGDARPDQIVGTDAKEVIKAAKEKKAKDFTINRKSDVNSIEDHKDAR